MENLLQEYDEPEEIGEIHLAIMNSFINPEMEKEHIRNHCLNALNDNLDDYSRIFITLALSRTYISNQNGRSFPQYGCEYSEEEQQKRRTAAKLAVFSITVIANSGN